MSLLERVYYFHGELKDNRHPNASWLVDQFEISLATARRDIAYLRDRMLAPLSFSSQKNGFYYTETSFNLPFEDSPKVTFLLGMLSKLAEEVGLGELPEVKQLEKRLGTMLSDEYQKIVNAIHCEWIEVEEIQTNIFEYIIESLVKRQVIKISYRSIQAGKSSQREIEPLRLVNYQGRWYLLAFCNLRNNLRLFHIARITSAELGNSPFSSDRNLPPGFLEDSFGIFKGEIKYHAEILFTGAAAELIAQQHWHKDQIISVVDAGIVLSLPVSDDREIILKVLQYGAKAKVIAPPALKQRVKDEVLKMSKIYNL